MKLSELLKGTDIKIKNDIEINGIEINSKNVKNGYIFFAIKGEKTDGNLFIDEAIKNGAIAVVSQKDIKRNDIEVIKVNDVHRVLSKASSNFYSNPSSKLKVIGITGTKGKTSVASFIEQIISNLGIECGVIGTINYRTNKRILMDAPNTTPYSPLLDKVIYEFVKDDCKVCIMEVSSHALKLKKVDEVEFDICIFTNLQSDHLDFHKTINDYKESKLRLFELLKASPKQNKVAAINMDDQFSKNIIDKIKGLQVISYSINQNSDIKASDIILTPNKTEFKLNFKNKRYHIKTPLCGKHNVYNILAAISAAYPIVNDIEKVLQNIENIKPVKGRLEKISTSVGFTIYIDYAHTEQSLKEILLTLNSIPHKNIITVFGCGGDRDKTKRAPMGKVASQLSNYVIITSDNPRTEDPIQIIKDIEFGIKEINGSNYIIIPDRAKAIEKAIEIATQDDIVLIAGKGHEDYQITSAGKIHFSDSEEVLKSLKKLKKG